MLPAHRNILYYFILVAPVERLIRIEEQSVIQRVNANGIQSPCSMSEINDESNMMDETPVKSLKILAQICVDELEKCNKNEMQTKVKSKENVDSIYISSDSESDASSTRSSQRGVITGGIKRKPSYSESGSSSDNDSSSDSSSSDSDDSDESDDDEDDDDEKEEETDKVKEKEKEKEIEIETESVKIFESVKNSEENEKVKIDVQQIVDEWSSDCDDSPKKVDKSVEENEIQVKNDNLSMVTEDAVSELFNPISLKDICRDVLQAHSMIIRYEVPSLRYLCEHTLASNGMEIPLICFVQEEQYEYMSTDQPSNEDEGVYLCLDSEFDETELANLFSGGGNGLYESIGIEKNESEECAAVKASLIDQCVALQNILSSPPPEDNQSKAPIEIISDETEYYMDPNGFHDSIQYEETVLPSENHIEDAAIAIAKLKKYLQKKYVHPLCYHKMFAINKLLRKYKVHQVSFSNKKSIVQKKVHNTISKLRQKSKQRRKPKKLATRRSARIADKIKQQCESDWKVLDKPMKSTKLNKISTKSDGGRIEPMENKRICKLMNVNEFIQNSGIKKKSTDTDNESITRDILKLIAQKRTLKRKLSICQRPNFSLDDDGYCYDEDGQISEMLSSFINNSFDEPRSESLNAAKKPRSRKSSNENRIAIGQEIKKKKVPPLTLKKHLLNEDKGKLKKSHSKEKNSKKDTATTKAQESSLPTTEAYAINKTEKKNTFLGTAFNFPTKASVKEVIPAKRTRFLSIDGSLMRYGAESKKSYNQMKSLKQNSESPEFGRGKMSAQKNQKTTTIDDVSTKKSIQKPKRIKQKNGAISEIPKPDEIKLLFKTAQKTTQSQKAQISIEKFKIPSKLTIKENIETKELFTSKPTAKESFVIEKSESEKSPTKAKVIQEPTSTDPTESSDIMTKEQSKSPENRHERSHLGNKFTLTENNLDNSNTIPPVKLSIKKQDKPLSERSLCSTMVSPLKIIIEPKRPLQMSLKDRLHPKDPLAIENNDEPNTQSGKSPPPQQHNNEKKEVHRKTRFSERITSLIEKPLPKDGNQVNKSLSIQIEAIKTDDSKKAVEKPAIKPNVEPETKDIVNRKFMRVSSTTPTSTTTQTLFPNTDMNTTIKPYLDIEMLLPSTRILQPKPAKRCLTRAQTISHSESPFQSYEPMQLRSSNFSWNQRKSGPLKEPANNQYRSSYKSMDTPFTIPKRKSMLNTVSPPIASPKANNVSAPLQRTPIDVSTFPDPESLEIPSIDLRSSSLRDSTLSTLPMSMPIPKPVSMPLPKPKPKPIDIPSIVNNQTVKGKSELNNAIFCLNIY